MGRFDILNGGFAEDISVMLTAGIHDKYFTHVSKHLSNRSQVTEQLANYYMQTLRSSQISVEKVHPNLDEMFTIFKTAIEQNNFIGCYTTNVILK